MVDSTKSRFAPYVMARLALSPSRDSDRGAASFFRKNLLFSPLSTRIYIYILDTNSFLWLDRTGASIKIFPLIHHTQSRSGMGGSEK